MESMIKSASYSEKSKSTVPEGAEVTKKEVRMEVEKIENGFILSKSFDINYTLDGSREYLYYTEKTYFKTNPMKIQVADKKEKKEVPLFDKI